MTSPSFIVKTMLRTLLLCALAVLLAAGCATTGKTPSRPQKSSARQQAKPVDAEAQKKYYDIGLRYYSKEKYGEARKAFQQVVDLGPKTALGLKAQENLKKIQQIMKTLKEIESK